MDWLHSPADCLYPLSLPADEASPPTDEASPIGSYIFSYCSLFPNIFLSAAGVLPSKSALKTAFFLRTYVDLLNYPFKREISFQV